MNKDEILEDMRTMQTLYGLKAVHYFLSYQEYPKLMELGHGWLMASKTIGRLLHRYEQQ